MFVKVQERMKHLRLHLQTTQHASAVSEGGSSKTATRMPNAVSIESLMALSKVSLRYLSAFCHFVFTV